MSMKDSNRNASNEAMEYYTASGHDWLCHL